MLSRSYRVPRAVWALSQRWIERVGVREPKAYAPRDFEGEVLSCAATYRAPRDALAMAEAYLDEGKTVMFLSACSYMLRDIIKELRTAGIPFHNPYRRKRGDWNPLHTGSGISGKDRLLAFLRHHDEWTYDDVYRWASVLRGNGQPVLRGARKVVEGWRGNSEPFPLHMLMQFLTVDDSSLAFAKDVEWLTGRLNEQGAKSLAYPCEIFRKRGAEILASEPRVTVGTIHSVKGGEADAVFLFPDLSFQGAKEWSSAHTRDAVIRQFYVGMTRARESLVLCKQSGPAAVSI